MRPVVVSSVAPIRLRSASAETRSAPSSIVSCGSLATTAAKPAAGSSPQRAGTAAPSSLSASATSSWVDSGFGAQSATSAPPAISARTSVAVSAVTCNEQPTRMSRSGCSREKRSRIERRTGICPSAQSMRSSPTPRIRGASELVPVVIRLERAIDGHVDVGGLLGRQLRQLRPERLHVHASDLLVEVLGQHVDLVLVLVRLREEL